MPVPVLKSILIICMCCVGHGDSVSVNDTKTLLKNLLADYDINVRPVADQSKPVNVAIKAYIKSIREFDEIQGKLSFVGALLVMWHDVNMMWNPALYGGIWETTVSHSNVWIPELILSSPAEDVDALGKKWNKIRFYADGRAMWFPVDLIESTCSVNVRNYPFDTQECQTSFNCIGYNENEVQLYLMTDAFDFVIYQENSLWKISESKLETGGMSQIDLILVLDRKPSFVIINVVLPILFLSLLNVVVFLLIPESGERISYAITVLLSIAVFMTIVSDLLPRSSDPVPVISYTLAIDMALSSLIVVVTVVNLKWYYTDDSVLVQPWLQSLYRVCTCSWWQSSHLDLECDQEFKLTSGNKRTKSIDTETITVQECNAETIESKHGRMNAELKEKVTWRMISQLVDRTALIMFTAASICNVAVFLAVTTIGST